MSCVFGRNVRTVPTSRACAGITLIAPGLPACIAHRLITAVSSGLTLRLTIDCDGGDDVPGDQHRIDGDVRMRAVAAAAVDQDLDPVGGRHRGPGRDADPPRRQCRPVMQRKHALGRKALEQTVVDHRLGAGVAFLAGLEDQVGDAVEVARLVQIAGGRQQHRRVAVVAAAVHASVVAGPVARSRFLPASAARPCRREGRPGGRCRRCGPE